MGSIVRPDHSTMVNNLDAFYNQASRSEIFDGIAWYPTALSDASVVAHDTGMPIVKTAGIVAAFSPQMPWTRNVSVARAAIVAFQNGLPIKGHTTSNVDKVRAILQSDGSIEAIVAILLGDVKTGRGMKTANFFLNILGVTVDSTAVVHPLAYTLRGTTTDRFHVGAAYGVYFGDNVPGMTPKQYDAISVATTEAAARHGLTAEQFQAIVWLVFHRVHGVAL